MSQSTGLPLSGSDLPDFKQPQESEKHEAGACIHNPVYGKPVLTFEEALQAVSMLSTTVLAYHCTVIQGATAPDGKRYGL